MATAQRKSREELQEPKYDKEGRPVFEIIDVTYDLGNGDFKRMELSHSLTTKEIFRMDVVHASSPKQYFMDTKKMKRHIKYLGQDSKGFHTYDITDTQENELGFRETEHYRCSLKGTCVERLDPQEYLK